MKIGDLPNFIPKAYCLYIALIRHY
jgi:hypothetical protein